MVRQNDNPPVDPPPPTLSDNPVTNAGPLPPFGKPVEGETERTEPEVIRGDIVPEKKG